MGRTDVTVARWSEWRDRSMTVPQPGGVLRRAILATVRHLVLPHSGSVDSELCRRLSLGRDALKRDLRLRPYQLPPHPSGGSDWTKRNRALPGLMPLQLRPVV